MYIYIYIQREREIDTLLDSIMYIYIYIYIYQDAQTIRGLFPCTCDAKLVEFVAGGDFAPAGRRPLKVGVVLSGGQAPGGHNVIAGIFDGIRQYHKDSAMIGFLDGPHGIFTGNFVEISPEIMDGFRNTGGFDMLGSGRHKIESEEHIQASMTTKINQQSDNYNIHTYFLKQETTNK